MPRRALDRRHRKPRARLRLAVRPLRRSPRHGGRGPLAESALAPKFSRPHASRFSAAARRRPPPTTSRCRPHHDRSIHSRASSRAPRAGRSENQWRSIDFTNASRNSPPAASTVRCALRSTAAPVYHVTMNFSGRRSQRSHRCAPVTRESIRRSRHRPAHARFPRRHARRPDRRARLRRKRAHHFAAIEIHQSRSEFPPDRTARRP